MLAVQGPRAAELLVTVLPGAADLAGLPYMAFADVAGIRVCRTGYTGEHGYELLVPADDAGTVWDALLAAAAPLDGRPCGLAARDTLRTEMGYPLHGQDLSGDITPVQAGSGWAVGWRKPEFWGRAALVAEKEAGPARRLRGLRATGRGVPRPGMSGARRRGRARGRDDLGDVLPDAEGGHRAGVDRHGVGCRRRRPGVGGRPRPRAALHGGEAAVRAVARALTAGAPSSVADLPSGSDGASAGGH